jgi:hypothetical protein
MTHRLPFLLLALGLVAGCSPAESTRGDLDRVDFSYQESCFQGCALEQPVLPDSRERISVTGPGDDAGINVGSSNPGVATFLVVRSCSPECENEIVVKTHAVGDAKLELYSKTGELVDATTIRVRAMASATFQRVDENGELVPVDRLELTSGQSVELWAEPLTADGKKLLGTQGFDWQSKDVNVIDLPATQGRSVTITGREPGTTTLDMSVGSGTAAIEVSVPAG